MSQVEAISPVAVDSGVDRSGQDQAAATRRPAPARFLVGAIGVYQSVRSGRPTGCRYLPTCSEYAVEAIDTHGAAHGTVLAVRRIARCTPWGGHGIDPVPDRRAP
jgi:hypothetical protein